MTYDTSLLSSLLVVGLLVVVYVRDRVTREPDPDSPAAARLAYTRGEIDVDELERRLDVALDEDAQRIRETVERVPGIGPEIGTAIAERYDSVDDVRSASIDELEDVPGVGGAKATAIKERLL